MIWEKRRSRTGPTSSSSDKTWYTVSTTISRCSWLTPQLSSTAALDRRSMTFWRAAREKTAPSAELKGSSDPAAATTVSRRPVRESISRASPEARSRSFSRAACWWMAWRREGQRSWTIQRLIVEPWGAPVP